MSTNNEDQQKIAQLQLIEQNMQNLLQQKQAFSNQLNEINSALEELNKTDNAYKIVGNIMVKSDKIELNKDLEGKKEIAELRIKSIEKQENLLKDKASKIQKEVLENMKKWLKWAKN